jgi:hypothetical protein
MTPAQHRALADDERAQAQLEGRLSSLPSEAREETPLGMPVMQATAGPTDFHLLEAARHAYHARVHRAAAYELERAEVVECRQIPVGVRAACPLLLGVAAVRDLPNGVRVELRVGEDVEKLATLMRCHLAYARVRGFEAVSPCPLYTRGVDIHRVDGQNAIDVVGADGEAIAEIRARAAELLSTAR